MMIKMKVMMSGSTLGLLMAMTVLFAKGEPVEDAADPAKPNTRPNILFAIADDWGYGHASAYGCSWVKTPAMDRVAKNGILFTHAYTPCGKCAPSRASIITGRNPWQLKAAGNHLSYFPPEFKTFVEALGENGYFAGMTAKGWGPGIAKNADGSPRNMMGQVFGGHKCVPPLKGAARDDYAENFNDFLAAAPKDKPWFFWYGCHEPHRPYEYGSGVAKGGKKITDIDLVPACWPDTPTVRNDMLDYAMEVEYFDRHLGRMIAELEKQGLLGNTLVVVTSDNGMPFPHDKGYAYQNADHLPLAIMWKNRILNPGRVVDDYVSFIDFAPTFLQVAGVDGPKSGMSPMTGRSLMEIFDSNQSGRFIPERDHVLVGKERNDLARPGNLGYPIRGIAKNDMLYLHNFEPDRWSGGNEEMGFRETDASPTKDAVLTAKPVEGQIHFKDLCFGKMPADQLFDLKNDPDCVVNLAAKVPFDAIQEQLFAELKSQGDPRMFGQGHIFDEYPPVTSFGEKKFDKN